MSREQRCYGFLWKTFVFANFLSPLLPLGDQIIFLHFGFFIMARYVCLVGTLRSECSLTAFDFALIVASFVVVLEVRHKVSFKVVPSLALVDWTMEDHSNFFMRFEVVPKRRFCSESGLTNIAHDRFFVSLFFVLLK